MSQKAAIREFFNKTAQEGCRGWAALAKPQQQHFENLHRTINTILDGTGDCTMEVVGQHRIKGIDLPVVRFAFSNAASLTLRDNNIDYIASVRSPVKVPEDVTSKTAYSLHWDMDQDSCKGLPVNAVKKSYAKNARSFTFQSWAHENFKYFVVEFAKLQKESIAQSQSQHQAQPVAQQPVELAVAAAVAAGAPVLALHSGS